MDDIAIKVEGVYKDFVLPQEKVNSIKSAFTSITRNRSAKKSEKQHALKDISFEIKKGEFFGIVGRNGSGKSTMLKILAGIYQPTKGSVSVSGKLVPFIELGVGFNPELTGRENVFLNGAMLGFSEKEVAGMYDNIVEFAELKPFMDQKLKNYSSGMQVRLAFSMATRAQADILLIDEVLAVGDADFQRKCFDYFKQLKRNKKTVVFVSHDMDAVREYCDRAALIDQSNLKFIGQTERIAQDYLRLFSKEQQSSDESSMNRWGDGRLKVTKLTVQVAAETITITETFTANEPIESYIAGIRIRNSQGQAIAGTNTKLESVKISPLQKGQAVTIEWVIPNLLSDGEYSLDPALIHDNGIDTYDWWDDAQHFSVKKSRHLPYPTDPGFNVKIT
jgi:ABC-2 type transport system ATP-binding protein